MHVFKNPNSVPSEYTIRFFRHGSSITYEGSIANIPGVTCRSANEGQLYQEFGSISNPIDTLSQMNAATHHHSLLWISLSLSPMRHLLHRSIRTYSLWMKLESIHAWDPRSSTKMWTLVSMLYPASTRVHV
jgi:hypothetical protein